MSGARPDTKFVVILSDGMADFPLDSRDGRTPLEAARTPNMDALAKRGVVGLVNPIPDSQPPGSDVGNLAVLGYDPDKYLTGRAPLEAAAMNLSIAEDQVAFRCNLVTLEDGRMEDYSAGHISSVEAAELIEAVQARLGSSERAFHAGVQYRHILLAPDSFDDIEATPPHDITGEPFAKHYPRGPQSDALIEWMEASRAVLGDHPVNRKRVATDKKPANSVWLWGQGKAPSIPTYEAKYGIKGGAITAVDLVRGIARYAGLNAIDVPGVTGFLDTNYAGKAEHGLSSLRDADFVYIHVEAPDEAGHMRDAQAKIEAIEAVDREIVGRALYYMERRSDVRVAVLPDHVTAISTGAHARGFVPYVAAGVGISPNGIDAYDEAAAAASDASFAQGFRWMDWFLGASD